MSSAKHPDFFDSAATTSQKSEPYRPLAERMRPTTLDEVVGQQHVFAPGKPLYESIGNGALQSVVLWGPPGCGKTTIARLLASHVSAHFSALSAVLAGVKQIREEIELARLRQSQGERTVLFIDEVHRFNKSQQDAFLPHIEDGTIHFVGATTENPSFELNNALLSRVRVILLREIGHEDLLNLLRRALASPHGLDNRVSVDEAVMSELAALADGDARRALNLLEVCADLVDDVIDLDTLREASGEQSRRFDKGGDAFYDQISALHKSVRGSDPDAALYWFCRMLDGGCDPRYLARRLIRMASEDIGNADPRALSLCVDAASAYERLGSPEGELALAQAAVYLACVPKSNAVYTAFGRAREAVEANGSLPVPLHLRNAPTDLMKDLGHGKDYRYPHDEEGAFAEGEKYLPDELTGCQFYTPTNRGLEIKIAERLRALREHQQAASESDAGK